MCRRADTPTNLQAIWYDADPSGPNGLPMADPGRANWDSTPAATLRLVAQMLGPPREALPAGAPHSFPRSPVRHRGQPRSDPVRRWAWLGARRWPWPRGARAQLPGPEPGPVGSLRLPPARLPPARLPPLGGRSAAAAARAD